MVSEIGKLFMDSFANWTKYCPRNNEKIGNQIVKISECIRVQDGHIMENKVKRIFFYFLSLLQFYIECYV